MIVVIPRRIQSGNAQTFGHWRDYQKERNAWYVLLRMRLPPLNEPPASLVSIAIRSYRSRLLDFANYVSGCKPIPDFLKHANYIKDDNPKWFTCTYEQFQVAKADQRTEIELP
jgi:hypothetical protein